MHEIPCIDEVDETMSTTKWTKQAVKRLQKLKSNCSLTAGLEASLSIAVGALVMLRRNIDTKIGLVNGSLGSVQAINCDYITVNSCLLYTSPSPRDRQKSRMPSSA